MLRRILIIILVVVVIIAAIFAIQWFLNRDSQPDEATDNTTDVVVDEGADVTENDVTIVEGDAGGDVPATSDTGAGDQPATGEQTTEGYPAAGSGEGDTAPADDSAAPVEGGTTSEAGTTDPNAGGGVPAGNGEAAPALGDAVAVEPPAGGIGSVAAVSPAAAFVQAGVPVTHTVTNNEWLTQLARCYGTTVADIQAANNYACPDLIHPGWVVNIANPGNAGPITINDTPCFNYHTVLQGETLYSIATQYGISYQWLARINAIYNYNTIYAGQQLVIPNPVDPVFTQIPPEPFFYSNCWYGNCPVYPAPVPVPYGQ